AGVLGEPGHVQAAVAILVGDDPGHGLALLARLAVHRVEAATQPGDRLADQLAGPLHLVAGAFDLLADEAAQLDQQLLLLTDHLYVLVAARRRKRRAQQQPGGKAEPAERLGGEDRPAHRYRP